MSSPDLAGPHKLCRHIHRIHLGRLGEELRALNPTGWLEYLSDALPLPAVRLGSPAALFGSLRFSLLEFKNVDRAVWVYCPAPAPGGLLRAGFTAAQANAEQVPGSQHAAGDGERTSDGEDAHR